MNAFPDFFKLEIGKYVDYFVKYLVHNFSDFFDVLKQGILWAVINIELTLQWLPWWLAIFIVFLLGWKINKLSSGIVYSVMLVCIGSFGLWELMMSTLAIVLTSVVISLLIGIPIGILMAYRDKLETIMKPILDGMQTMPSFVYLIPAVIIFRMGKVPGVFATTIYAIAPAIRLTNLAIRGVSKETIEAARSFGASPWQILLKVELPQALPTIMAGVNQTTMMAMSMVVIASMIGAKGLGSEVLIAINRIDIARGTEAGLAIVFVAIIIDRLTQGIAERFKLPE
ncbi:MAG: choline ABC transporter permease subunit [Alkaliphilus sp.]|nr:proline/glycine betaine ABC transporter permease [bacterium AH-315-L21]MBN4069440.1 proline/glycine betaine ABC transporter permease [bacterium AH-315-G05]MBN4074500.1 proline/glycine betaine ABC transporter permease [bacterium AH-315-E09]PHS30643.1 MAG: choline ABC transporter permease subunit [Alkaliphilus sp.]